MGIDVAQLSPAEKLLWHCGVREPSHIDLEGIAIHKGASVVYRRLDGCVARLVASAGQAVISVGHSPYPGRQRFSLAHELAHWICDRNVGSFSCANEDIGPQNAAAKHVEAHANAYASQLILPSYLVAPWIQGKKTNLDTAKALAKEFDASLTASAIKMVTRSATPACLVCYDKTKLLWIHKNIAFPHDLFVQRELHHDTIALSMAYGQAGALSRPIKEPASRWMSGPDCHRKMVESQSLRLPDQTILTVVAMI